MYYRLLVLCISLLLVGSIVLASEIRVNTIGFPGLVDDEEVDISLNPAFLGLMISPRIYVGGNFLQGERDTNNSRYNSDSRLGHFEYIFPVSSAWIDIRYEPSIYRDKTVWNWYDYGNIEKETIRYDKDNIKNLLVGAGVAISEKLSLGMRVAIDYWQSNINGLMWNDMREQGRENKIDIGCQYGSLQGSNIGIIISGITQAPPDGKFYDRKEIAATILPTWPLNANNSVKGIVKVMYGYSSSVIAGLSWNYQYSPAFLFDFALIHHGVYSYGTGDASYFQAGVEKKIVSRLIARSGITIALGRGYGTLPDAFAFGLGYEPSSNFSLDLAWKKYSRYFSDYNREIGIAGSYYFSLNGNTGGSAPR